MARFYANENFPLPVVVELRRLGHDVLTVQETGKADRAWPDEEVLSFAATDRRALLTFNRRHFVRLHAIQPSHAGIVAWRWTPMCFGWPTNSCRNPPVRRPCGPAPPRQSSGRLVRVRSHPFRATVPSRTSPPPYAGTANGGLTCRQIHHPPFYTISVSARHRPADRVARWPLARPPMARDGGGADIVHPIVAGVPAAVVPHGQIEAHGLRARDRRRSCHH